MTYLQNGTHESLYPLRYSGGAATSKALGALFFSRPLHSEVTERLFKEDNDIPDDATAPPYALEVAGFDPTPDPEPSGGRGAIGLGNMSSRVREIRRQECQKVCKNPEGVTLKEPAWKS
jgi:hypothetical protein